MQERVCAYCHKVYYISDHARKRLKYCSRVCKDLAHKSSSTDTVCPICGKHVHSTASQPRIYCSKECYAQAQKTPEHIEMRKQKLMERWGVDSVIDIPGVREKKAQTSLQHFGVENPLQSEEVRNKGKITSLQRYNVENPSSSSIIREKVKKTCRDRYGVDSVLASKTLREDWQEKLFAKEGIRFTKQRQLSPEARKAFFSADTLRDFILSQDTTHAPTLYTLLGVDDTTFYSYIDKYDLRSLVTHTDSRYEHEIKALFPTINFHSDRTLLDGKEIDLYSPEHKVGIEFNGNYWHSELHKDKNYHKQKSELVAAKGVFLFHIFEYEWNNPQVRQAIINRLRNIFHLNTTTIYARKCELKILEAKEAQDFYTNNHVQGRCAAQIHVGLTYAGDVVASMSFKTNGVNNKYQYELCRFCSKAGVNVVGGASRLFKHFVKKYNPQSIISYSDIAKTTGNIYKTLGFVCAGVAHPQYHWVKQADKVLTRYQCQIKQLIKRGWKTKDDGLTEEQVMHAQGYYRVYDCGKKRWVWYH